MKSLGNQSYQLIKDGHQSKQNGVIQQQCYIIQNTLKEFMNQMQGDEMREYKPIAFAQKKQRGVQHFLSLQKTLITLSQMIIQLLINKYKIKQVNDMIEIYYKMLIERQQYERSWQYLKNKQQKNPEYCKIYNILTECIRYEDEKLNKINLIYTNQKQLMILNENNNIKNLQDNLWQVVKQCQQLKIIKQQLIKQNQNIRNNLQFFQLKLHEFQEKQKLYIEEIQQLNPSNKYQKQCSILDNNDISKNNAILKLQQQIKQKQRIIKQLQHTIKNTKNTTPSSSTQIIKKSSGIDNSQLIKQINELHSQLKKKAQHQKSQQQQFQHIIQQKNKIIKQLSQKTKLFQNQVNHIRSIQTKVSQQHLHKFHQYQHKIATLQYEIDSLKLSIEKLSTSNKKQMAKNQQYEIRVQKLEKQKKQISKNYSELKQNQNKVDKTNNVDKQVHETMQQITKLKKVQSQNYIGNDKITYLQGTLNQKNQKIYQFQYKIKNLQKQINYSNIQLSKSRTLNTLIQKKDEQLAQLKKQKQVSTSNIKTNQKSKQIQYLNQKIRSLQDLIDVFIDQRLYIDKKIKQFISRENNYTQIIYQLTQSNNNNEKYYLRKQGLKLQQIIKNMQSTNKDFGQKLQQLTQKSRILENSKQGTPRKGIKQIIDKTKTFVSQTKNYLAQKQQFPPLNQNQQYFDYITQYVYRIIIYFAQILPDSIQAKNIWNQLQKIKLDNIGEQYFITLQQFTKYILQESAIQVYRRTLKQKINQLDQIKFRMNGMIDQRLLKERKVFQKTQLSSSRIQMFRDRKIRLAKSQVYKLGSQR